MPHKIHQHRAFHRHHSFQPQKDHPTHYHTCWQSNGRNSILRQSNKNLGNSNGGKEIRQPIQITERALQNKKYNVTEPATKTGAPASLRVPLYSNNSTRQTRSMTPPNPQVPRLSTPSVPRVDHSTETKHKHWTKKHKTKFHTTAPAHNTRLRAQATEPEIRTRARTQLTKLENKTQTGHASTVDSAISQLENDVHQDLAVIDTDTGKIISYRQLMRNPKKIGARSQQTNSGG